MRQGDQISSSPFRDNCFPKASRFGATTMGIRRNKGRGVHPPEPMMHFSLFQIPPLFKIFLILGKKNFRLFPKNVCSSAKVSHDVFQSLTLNFEFPPIFAKTLHFPLFREIYYFPFLIFPLHDFRNCTCFFTYFTCLSFPSSLTMMHLCITQCTYWTPLNKGGICHFPIFAYFTKS